MITKGIIRLKTSNEEITITTNCSKDAFIELSKILYTKTDILIQSLYFDKELTNEELKILTN